jgi:hypothetical protein
MERRRKATADDRQNKNNFRVQISESEVVFGPYRNVIPGESYNPEDLTIHNLLPTRKYGSGVDQNEPEAT